MFAAGSQSTYNTNSARRRASQLRPSATKFCSSGKGSRSTYPDDLGFRALGGALAKHIVRYLVTDEFSTLRRIPGNLVRSSFRCPVSQTTKLVGPILVRGRLIHGNLWSTCGKQENKKKPTVGRRSGSIALETGDGAHRSLLLQGAMLMKKTSSHWAQRRSQKRRNKSQYHALFMRQGS